MRSIGGSALDAALLMNEHKNGALVVIDHGKVSGIFTERDLLRRVVGKRMDPTATKVHQVMTMQVICCRPDTGIEEVRLVLNNRRIHHLPVIDQEGRLEGVISIGDLNAWELDG